MNRLKLILTVLLLALAAPCAMLAAEAETTEEKAELDVKEIIFDHLGDGR